MEFVAIPIIIEAVNNGLKIIMMVREKIREYKARNQLLKAMEKRISSLIPCFELLYTRVNRLSEQAINNIIDIVLRINDFCARISASQDIWTKIKRFFNNGDEVKEMISLNKELNTAQKDLQIPLKLEESIKIDQIFATLQEIIPKTYELFEKYEKDNKILPLSKKVLTNEEAFIFWIGNF